jgi:lipopolysaccharide transport system ATP-binding protein
MSDVVISIENLSKRYLIGHQSAQRERYLALRDTIGREARNFARKAADLVRGRPIVQGDEVEELWALKDVSFEVKVGEVVGIIGRNGAGKSTLLKILSRITEPTLGRVRLRGRVGSLLEVGTGFHPELTGRENIFLNGAILGMSRSEITRKFDEIVAFAEVEKFLDTPVKRYSSGMYVRLAFAVAAHLEPKILIVDEVLAVGDVSFQRKCLGKMSAVAKQGRTILFVSHNMAAIRSLTSRCIVLSSGKAIFEGDQNTSIMKYLDSLNVSVEKGRLRGCGVHSTIRSAQLISEKGEPIDSYIPGTPLRVETTFSTDGSPSLSIEVLLVGADQHKLGLASLHQFHGETLPRVAGTYQTVLEIEPLWIASGSYSLDVAISVVNSHWDHYANDAVTFDVPMSNRGGQSWDFKQSLGHGAFALALTHAPQLRKVDLNDPHRTGTRGEMIDERQNDCAI